MSRLVPLLFLFACGDGASLTFTWTVLDGADAVACPDGAEVEMSVPVFEVWPCTDGSGTVSGLDDGQFRAELDLLVGSSSVASFTRLVAIDGSDVEEPAVFVLP